jgi:hypothetical protein
MNKQKPISISKNLKIYHQTMFKVDFDDATSNES